MKIGGVRYLIPQNLAELRCNRGFVMKFFISAILFFELVLSWRVIHEGKRKFQTDNLIEVSLVIVFSNV